MVSEHNTSHAARLAAAFHCIACLFFFHPRHASCLPACLPPTCLPTPALPSARMSVCLVPRFQRGSRGVVAVAACLPDEAGLLPLCSSCTHRPLHQHHPDACPPPSCTLIPLVCRPRRHDWLCCAARRGGSQGLGAVLKGKPRPAWLRTQLMDTRCSEIARRTPCARPPAPTVSPARLDVMWQLS